MHRQRWAYHDDSMATGSFLCNAEEWSLFLSRPMRVMTSLPELSIFASLPWSTRAFQNKLLRRTQGRTNCFWLEAICTSLKCLLQRVTLVCFMKEKYKRKHKHLASVLPNRSSFITATVTAFNIPTGKKARLILRPFSHPYIGCC